MDHTTDHCETEERIFEAALQVFSVKGKDGARMQEIADAAGINKAMLHYYFRSKDRLYEAVFKHVFGRFMRSFAEAARETDTFRDFLKTFIYSYIDFEVENPCIVRLMITENLAGGGAMARHLKEKMASNREAPTTLFIEKLREAVERGEIRPVDPMQTLLTVISACIFFVVTRPTTQLLNPAAQDWDAFVEARKAHVFDLLYHGLKPV